MRSLSVRVPRLAGPLLFGVLCLFVYNANLRTIGAGDTLPARYQPLILWHDGTFDLDSNARLVEHGHRLPRANRTRVFTLPGGLPPDAYWLIRTHSGHLVSLYPVVAPVLALPLYLPAALWLDSEGWSQPNIDRVAEIAEKLSASVFAALAGLLLFLVLRRERNRWALAFALAFAFGTDTWMVSSQALWQHGSGELLVALGLWLALGSQSPRRTGLLGFVCALIAANRQPDIFISVALAIPVVLNRKRDLVWLCAGAALPLAALLYYNLVFIGNLAGAAGLASRPGQFFHVQLLGVPGLLVSPTKGLLIFSPFLIFVPLGLARRLRTSSSRRLAIALSVAVAAEVLVASQGDWRAGASWGPRWLTDLLPILIWMLAPAPSALRPRARALLAALIVAAIGIQAIGAFWYTRTSDARILAGGMSSAWNLSYAPFISELEHPPASFELPCNARGSIDVPPAPVANHGATAQLKPGGPLEGWALACDHTPAQVILLIDGTVIGEAQQFLVRPDVNRTLHVHAPSGWSITADTSEVTPGKHVLALAVRVSSTSDIRIVREQPVIVTAPPSLRALAIQAAQQLRRDQSSAGYWITQFTSSTQYVAPQKEMNTYLTSILIDVLTPVAGRLGLTAVVARARHELGAQIEGDGLVRYHGLPHAPPITKLGLGCAITPDADDTALAWRIAGSPSDPRLHRTLATLTRYRNAQRLYRTWLAPVGGYHCIDPGHDPDPADIGINMHVYMMLHEFAPAAAQSLCSALRRWSGSDENWVYYSQTALVPYIRAAQLEQLGCPIPLPAARLARSAPGQAWWDQAVESLVQASASAPRADNRQTIGGFLEQIAANDFALLRESPPLIFNNDMSANVKRFYWSADFGYALWLALYETAMVAR
jgi:hypothetical protein